MLKKIALALAALVVVLVLVVVTRPAAYRVTRSVEIAAPPSMAYAHVVDFRRWEAWSPWAKLDRDMQTSYAGQDGAVGATYHWKGNDKVGEGRMTLIEARPPAVVGIRLEFLAPWKSTSLTRFEFVPTGSGTSVTWTLDGNNDLAGKAFSLFSNLDTMIGGDFERGLASLRTVSESQARATRVAVPAVAR